MMKKFTYALSIVAIAVIAGHAGVNNAGQPPQTFTGADGGNCTACHGDFAVNSGGGSVSINGLPASGFVPNTTYTFSLTVTHGSSNRRRFGFSIAARNAAGQDVGTFSSLASNAAPNGAELSHNNAPFVPGGGTSSTFTFSNLRWTAPATGTGNNPVTFYFVGNAANGTGGTDGDFIYTGSTVVGLPITLSGFTGEVRGSNVLLKWSTSTEVNSSHFVIEKSADNQRFIDIAKVDAAGNSNSLLNYQFTDDKPAYYERATFYRLALVDKDGSRKYSNVVSVNLKATQSFVKKLYPNPVKAGGNMQVELVSEKAQQVTITMVSMSGKIVKQLAAPAIKGSNIIDVQLGRFMTAGMYSLVVTMEEQTQQIPVLVQY